MHIIFVNYHSLACNSGGHILALARELSKIGITVTVFVPFAANAHIQSSITADGPECLEFSQFNTWLPSNLSSRLKKLIVAWTPRENVRRFVQEIQPQLHCPYFVHLEDHEYLITATHLGLRLNELLHFSDKKIDSRFTPDLRLSHPKRAPEFIAKSSGITALTQTLTNFAPAGHPNLVFWPGANNEFFKENTHVNFAKRHSLHIADNEIILVYPGSVHPMNRAEIRSLYLATVLLNRHGIPARLVRTGQDHIPVFDEDPPAISKYIINLGHLPTPKHVAEVLQMANYLVQPGRSDLFNDYRFPSKLPEFFATARPVLLPRSNLGLSVRDGLDAILLQRGDALEISDILMQLISNPSLAKILSERAGDFAKTHFQWPDIALRVMKFYNTIFQSNQPESNKNGLEN
ncbi:hypothetical protein OpiT1DRAFT_00230 [Opitutaceae bacterium TAV1]|nr:hypothetical protein OpiT1DRAFT_00230 [Opitutaceae bacterium TAV1]